MTRFKSVNAITILSVLFIAGASQADDRKLLYLLSVTGNCSELVIEGASLPCKGTLLQTNFDDGRIGFYFVSDTDKGKIVTFSGLGQQQVVVSDNSRLQPIDSVIGKAGITKLEGECFFENPFIGPARIECSAKSDGGGIYSANFLTDGEKPEMKEVE